MKNRFKDLKELHELYKLFNRHEIQKETDENLFEYLNKELCLNIKECVYLKNLNNIKNFKIIIVDNKGDKKLKNRITKKFEISKYYLSNKNLGFSKGFNKALNFCKTKYAFIKNADCYIDEDNIIKLYDYIKNNNDFSRNYT